MQAVLRLAWRDVRRRKGRTALVAVMIGLPVAIMLLIATNYRTSQLTADEAATFQMGRADGLLSTPDDPVPQPDTPKRVTTLGSEARVKVNGRRYYLGVMAGDITHPLLAGKYEIRSGRLPSATGEIAVSSAFAHDAGLHLGDTFRLGNPATDRTVVGTFRDRGSLGMDAAVVPVGDLGRVTITSRFLSGAVPAEAMPRAAFSPTHDGDWIAVLYTCGLVAMFCLGLIVVAAFASGARRQLREVGLIAASGGDPRQLRRALALQGTVTGLVGAALGYALFTGGMIALAPHLDWFSDHVVPGIDVSLFDLVAVGLMAVAAATFAAWLPARTTARTPVLSALAGRMPLKAPNAGLPLVGLAISGVGLLGLAASLNTDAWFGSAMSGIAITLGGALCTPWLVGLMAGAAARTGGARRLAARQIARHRSRTGPLVAAIMAVCGLTLVLAMAVETQTELNRRDGQYTARNQDIVRLSVGYYAAEPTNTEADNQVYARAGERLQSLLPGSVFADVRNPSGPGWYLYQTDEAAMPTFVRLTTPDTLRALGAPQAAELLDRDGIVTIRSTRTADVTLELSTDSGATIRKAFSAESSPETMADPTVSAGVIFSGQGPAIPISELPVVIIGPKVLEAFGHRFDEAQPDGFVLAPRDLTAADRAAVDDLSDQLATEADERADTDHDAISIGIYYERPSHDITAWARLALIGGALLLVLAVVAIGLTLSAVEQRDETATLIAIGAPARIRRRMRAAEAGTLTLMGALLAVPLGGLAAWIVTRHMLAGDWRQHLGVDPQTPWEVGIALVLGVPLVAAGVTWLCTRSPRRVDVNRAA